MIDNTRLSDDHRVAIVLTEYKPGAYAKIILVLFRGHQAGMKGQTYYADVVRQVGQRTRVFMKDPEGFRGGR